MITRITILLFAILAIVGTVFSPINVNAAADIGCTCKLKVGLLTQSGKDQADQGKKLNDLTGDAVLSIEIKPKGGDIFSYQLDNNESFGFDVPYLEFLGMLNEGVVLKPAGTGVYDTDKGKAYHFPVSVFEGVAKIVDANSASWNIDITKKPACMPEDVVGIKSDDGNFIYGFGIAAAQFSSGVLPLYMYCTDDKPDEKEPVSSPDDVGGGDPNGTGISGIGVKDLNQLGTTSLTVIIGRFIKILMGLIGSVALLVLVFGGFLWMTAAGNAEKTGKASALLVWGAMGVMVILSSYAIVNFIFDIF